MSTIEDNLFPLMDLIQSYQYSQALFTALELGIFQALESNPLTIDQLSKKFEYSHRGLEYLLIALESMNLVNSYRKNQRLYFKTNKAIIKYFGNKGRLIHWTLHHKKLYELWKDLSYCVKNGKPLLGNTHDLNVENYALGLMEEYMFLPNKIHEVVDFSGKIRLLDVGGGAGHCSILASLENPDLSSTVFDREEVIAIAKTVVNRYHLNNKISLLAGDVLNSNWPKEYDIVLLSNILHGKSEWESLQVINNSYHSLKPNGRIIVNELTDISNSTTALFNLNMLICTSHGQVWNKNKLSEMLLKSGFKRGKWHKFTQTRWLIEAKK